MQGLQLVLSDASEGMLAAAKQVTGHLGISEYLVIDAQAIPFPENSFDVLIANHMLYHVPQLEQALREIVRVLRPGGALYATTLGRSNLMEFFGLLRTFDPAIDFGQDALFEAFGLESGEEHLRRHFAQVSLRRYPDSLQVTEAEPLVDYVLSHRGMGNIAEKLTEDKIAQLRRFIAEAIARQGHLDITKDAGMLIARTTAPKSDRAIHCGI